MVVNDCARFQLVVLDDIEAVDCDVCAPLGEDRAIVIILVDGNDIVLRRVGHGNDGVRIYMLHVKKSSVN